MNEHLFGLFIIYYSCPLIFFNIGPIRSFRQRKLNRMYFKIRDIRCNLMWDKPLGLIQTYKITHSCQNSKMARVYVLLCISAADFSVQISECFQHWNHSARSIINIGVGNIFLCNCTVLSSVKPISRTGAPFYYTFQIIIIHIISNNYMIIKLFIIINNNSNNSTCLVSSRSHCGYNYKV